MSFIEIMHTYFKGKKLEALCFILPVGVLLIILGCVALKAEKGGFAFGVLTITGLLIHYFGSGNWGRGLA